jgi:hypothetical protein
VAENSSPPARSVMLRCAHAATSGDCRARRGRSLTSRSTLPHRPSVGWRRRRSALGKSSALLRLLRQIHDFEKRKSRSEISRQKRQTARQLPSQTRATPRRRRRLLRHVNRGPPGAHAEAKLPPQRGMANTGDLTQFFDALADGRRQHKLERASVSCSVILSGAKNLATRLTLDPSLSLP